MSETVLQGADAVPKLFCSRCGAPKDRSHYSYCKECHARAQRINQIDKIISPEERLKDIARSKAGVYLRRGLIERKSCSVCGDERVKAEMHHEDYDKPYDIVWLCPPHHRIRHKIMRDEKAKMGNSLTPA